MLTHPSFFTIFRSCRITKSFVDFNGVVPEKFDIVNMTHKVQVEYGNVGVDFKFIPREGFGWMNASYQVGLGYMDRGLRRALGAVMDPTRVFKSRSEASLLASANASKSEASSNKPNISDKVGGEGGIAVGSNNRSNSVSQNNVEQQVLHPAELHHHPVRRHSLVEQPLDVTTRLLRPHRT